MRNVVDVVKNFKDESAVKRRPKSDKKLPEEEEKIAEIVPSMNQSEIKLPISQPSSMEDHDNESHSLELSNQSSKNVNSLS